MTKKYTTNREISLRAIRWFFPLSSTTFRFETPGGGVVTTPPPGRSCYEKWPGRARVKTGSESSRRRCLISQRTAATLRAENETRGNITRYSCFVTKQSQSPQLPTSESRQACFIHCLLLTQCKMPNMHPQTHATENTAVTPNARLPPTDSRTPMSLPLQRREMCL